LPHPGTEGV